MTRPFTPLEEKIQTVLEKVRKELTGQNAANAVWTLKIKQALCNLALNVDSTYKTNASGEGLRGEWLFDLVWYREEEIDGEAHLTSLDLVMESEWLRDWSNLRDDFQKLLIARAAQKVMIFEVANEAAGEDRLSKMQTALKSFNGRLNDANYMFAAYNVKTSHFKFYTEAAR